MKTQTLDNSLTLLNNIPLFAGLPMTVLQPVIQAFRLQALAKGQVLFQRGEQPGAVHFIISGQLKRTSDIHADDGKILELLYPGYSLGIAAWLGQRPYTAYAVALERSQILSLNGSDLDSLMHEHPLLTQRIVTDLARRQMKQENDIIASRVLTGTQRILDYLLRQAGQLHNSRGETAIVLPSRKQFIASRLGLTPETLSRGLRELSDLGLIVVDGKHILLQNAAIRQQFPEMFGAPFPPAEGHDRFQTLSSLGQSSSDGLPASAGSVEQRLANLHHAINKAGRLRMLSQRMAKAWLMLGRNILPQRSQTLLQQSITEFDKLLQDIHTLNRQYGSDSAILTALNQVEQVWPGYQQLLENQATADLARELFKLNEQVLLAAHRLTQACAQAASTPYSQLLDLAGLERMLSQRMAKFYMFLEWEQAGIDSAACLQGLQHAMQEFEAGLDHLGLQVNNDPQIRIQLERVAQQWQRMRQALDSTHDQNSGPLTATICTFSERLLKKMDAAITLYSKKQQEKQLA